jgi:DNA (cytosine-5)-methyltransferase 1
MASLCASDSDKLGCNQWVKEGQAVIQRAAESVAHSVPEVSLCLNAGGMARNDSETETFIPVVTHTLRGEGFDARGDGTGRGVPLVVRESGQGYWMQDDIAGTLRAEGEDRPSRPSHAIGAPMAFQPTQDRISGIEVCHAISANENATAAVALVGSIDYENNAGEGDAPTGPLLKGSPTGGGRPLPAVAIRTANTSANGHGIAHDVSHTLDQAQGQAVAFQSSQSGVREVYAHATLDANNGSRRHNGVMHNMQVRRLTPRECERLQGFPDDYTAIPWRGKPAAECPDGPRYKALGNSMAVPVMRWIGQRIHEVNNVKC